MDEAPTARTTTPPIYYILGAPGAGKGTLCALLAQHYRCVHLSVGDMLRSQLQFLENEREQGRHAKLPGDGLTIDQFKDLMEKREILPAATIVALVRRKLKEYEGQMVIVDGFPRSLASARLANVEIGVPDRVFFFDCVTSEARRRFLDRRRRTDDDAGVFDLRFAQFSDSNGVILDFFRSEIGRGDVVTINTTSSTEESWRLLQDKVDGRLTNRDGGSGGWLLQEGGSGAESGVGGRGRRHVASFGTLPSQVGVPLWDITVDVSIAP